MSCSTCGRREVAGSCKDGYTVYLSGDFPCVFNKTGAGPRNLRELGPLSSRAGRLPAQTENVAADLPEREYSAEGLEDLL